MKPTLEQLEPRDTPATVSMVGSMLEVEGHADAPIRIAATAMHLQWQVTEGDKTTLVNGVWDGVCVELDNAAQVVIDGGSKYMGNIEVEMAGGSLTIQNATLYGLTTATSYRSGSIDIHSTAALDVAFSNLKVWGEVNIESPRSQAETVKPGGLTFDDPWRVSWIRRLQPDVPHSSGFVTYTELAAPAPPGPTVQEQIAALRAEIAVLLARIAELEGRL